jgi:hypothetical protein
MCIYAGIYALTFEQEQPLNDMHMQGACQAHKASLSKFET